MHRSNFWIGAVLIFLGAIFLLANLDIFDHPFHWVFRNFWPILIIVVGLFLIFRSARRSSSYIPPTSDNSGQPYTMINRASKIFGDIHQEAANCDINGMNFSTTFGNISINLSGGKLQGGDNKADFSAIFGDITVVVPKEMEVFAYGSATFGDLHILGKSASGISNNLTTQTDGFDSAASKVYITAGTTFGNVKIYRA